MNAGSEFSPAGSCRECGGILVSGTCPACALIQLLEGGLERWPDKQDAVAVDCMEFGRYSLIRKLAAGGMGVVYLAEDRMLKRTVALKMIRSMFFAGAVDVARFKVEAEAAAGLDHPNIVPIYEVGEFEGQPFFTMKRIEGGSLADHMRSAGGRLPAREVAALVSCIARAVHHAHQRGVLHRDLKPGNILLDESGTPWLTDFGLAKLVNEETGLTLSTDHLGTLHYMSPEVAAGGAAHDASTASDVWALGVILWEMLGGSLPFQGPGTVETLRRITGEEPVWPAGARADADLVTLARRCMEKKPERRLASAAELANDLDRWLCGEPVKARPVTQWERLVKWVRRKPALAALYALAILGVLVGMFLLHQAERAVDSLTIANARLETSLRISTATKLAGDARLQVKEDPNRALLLAVEAVEMTEHSSEGTLPEAASALMGVLTEAGGWDATPGGLRGDYLESFILFSDFERNSAQISPDGRWLVCLDCTVPELSRIPAALYDMKNRTGPEPLRRWDIRAAGEAGIQRCAWLPDSRRVISLDDSGRVRIWNVVTDAMERGHGDSGTPSVEECGMLPVTDGMKLTNVKLSVEQQGTWIVWMEQPALPADGEAEGGQLARVVRTQVTPQGLRQDAAFALPELDGFWDIARLPQGGRWLVAYSPEGQVSPVLADLSGSSPILHRLSLKGRVAEALMDKANRNLVISLTDNHVYHLRLPAPGSPPGEWSLRLVADFHAILNNMEISPDGRWVALAGNSKLLQLVPLDQADSVPVLLELDCDQTLTVNFSQDGRWLAAGGTSRTVQLWKMDDIRSRRLPLQLRGLPSSVGGIRFSSDNSRVVAIGAKSVFRYWHLDGISGGAIPLRLGPGGVGVLDSVVSPDGQWSAAACGNLLVGDESGSGLGDLILQRLDGLYPMVLGKFGRAASGAAFSPDGRWIAGAGADGTVKVWDCREAVRCAVTGDPAPAPQHIFTLKDVRTIFTWRLAFHPDGRLFMVEGDGILFCWDLDLPDPDSARKSEKIHSINYLLPDLRMSPDGRILAVARHAWDGPGEGREQFGAQVFLYDVSRREEWPLRRTALLSADFLERTQIAFSPDSRWLASGAVGYGPCLWDLHAADIPASRLRVPIFTATTTGVAFSPASDRLAIGAGDGQLYFWDWRNSSDLRSVTTDSGIHRLTWIRDDRLLVSGESGNLALWDANLGRLKTLARNVAGRQLSDAERKRFLSP